MLQQKQELHVTTNQTIITEYSSLQQSQAAG